FQAEDGIRDFHVTGVQTCALPIWRSSSSTRCAARTRRGNWADRADRADRPTSAAVGAEEVVQPLRRLRRQHPGDHLGPVVEPPRSEERRVGKEYREGVWIGK